MIARRSAIGWVVRPANALSASGISTWVIFIFMRMRIAIRGTSAAGAAVGSSASQSMTWSKDDLAGGMYFWTTPKNQPTDQAARIYRWDFGSTTQSA